jgi:copper chaperone CopZ
VFVYFYIVFMIDIYTVVGMTCEACATHVKEALEKHEQVKTVVIDLENKKATVTMQNHVELVDLNAQLKPLKKYSLIADTMSVAESDLPKKSLKTYWPLILVMLYIVGGTLHLGWVRGWYDLAMTNFVSGFSPLWWMNDFMGLFFVIFAFFKLLDIAGFAMSYRGYDIVAKRFPVWGYVYPFVELSLGLLYLHNLAPFWTNVATVIVMSVSIVGVVESVLNKRKIKCACLGTGFNLPMSTVTIIEDGVMILMALAMLLFA